MSSLSRSEAERLARKTLELDDAPDESLPTFYFHSFLDHKHYHPYDTNFIVELAKPGKRGTGGNGYGIATCMEDYCWKVSASPASDAQAIRLQMLSDQDVVLGPDPERPEGGKQDGFGSFWEYQLHCQTEDHVKGRNERCRKNKIPILPSPLNRSQSSSSSSGSHLVAQQPGRDPHDLPGRASAAVLARTHLRPKIEASGSRNGSAYSSALSFGNSAADSPLARAPLLGRDSIDKPSNSSSLASSRPQDLRSLHPLPDKRSVSSRSDTKPLIPISTTSALHGIDTHRRVKPELPVGLQREIKREASQSSRQDAKPSASKRPIYILSSDDEEAVVALAPNQIPSDMRKNSNKDAPFVLTDDEDAFAPAPSTGTGRALSRTSSGQLSGLARTTTAVASLASMSSSAPAHVNVTHLAASPTASRAPLTLPPLPLQTKRNLIKREMKEIERLSRGLVTSRTPGDLDSALLLARRHSELAAMFTTIAYKAYSPPSGELLRLYPILQTIAGLFKVPLPEIPPAPPNPAVTTRIESANAIAGPSTLLTLPKLEAEQFPVPGTMPLPGKAALGISPSFGLVLPPLNALPPLDDEDDEWKYERPMHGEQLHEFFEQALDDFAQDADVDAAAEKLGMKSMTDRFSELTIPLMPHQILGVSWMIEKERDRKFKGGLLCDAMGLGKTVQTMAAIVGNQSEDRRVRTTLIVAPLALLAQWKAEIESKTTPDLLTVVIHHGTGRAKSANRLKQADVILTTYGTLSSEFGKEQKKKPKKKKLDETADSFEDTEEEEFVVKKKGPLYGVKWYRVVLDEAHYIRNRGTRATKAVWELDAIHRWSLTGTLINNSLTDIFPHLRFLMISPCRDWSHFNKHIASHQKRRPKMATKRAQAILRTCMLRRHKESTLNGRRLLDLPPKITEIVELDFTEDERAIYDSVEQRLKVRFNHFLKQGTVLKHYNCIFVWLMRLRQLTGKSISDPVVSVLRQRIDTQQLLMMIDHPWLVRRNPGDAAHPSDWTVSNEELFGEQAGAFEAAQDAALAIDVLGQAWVDDVTQKLKDRHQRLIQSAKQGADAEDNAEKEHECPICFEPMADEAISSCKHSFCKLCIAEVFSNPPRDIDLSDEETQAGARKCPMCRTVMKKDAFFSALAFFNPETEKQQAKDEEGEEEDVKPKISERKLGKRRAVDEPDVKPSVKRLSVGKGKAKPEPQRNDEVITIDEYENTIGQVLPSTKMNERLLEYLAEEGTKVIVFSQFVTFLDLCHIYLDRLGVGHRMFIGSMKQDERDAVVKEFTGAIANEHSPRVMLISLKCGGVGLNLTSANKVISLDLAWNAATENQAFDRAHRIGQTKPVDVRRVIIRNTIEQRILALQEQKEALADGAMGEGNGGRLGRLSVQDLIRLFGVEENEG